MSGGAQRQGHSPTRRSLQNIRCRSKEARARQCRGFATFVSQRKEDSVCPYLPALAQTDPRTEMKQIKATRGDNCPPHMFYVVLTVEPHECITFS